MKITRPMILRSRAERRYFNLEDQIREAYEALAGTANPAERCSLLTAVAVAQENQAEIHDEAVGVDWYDDEFADGRGLDAADSKRYEATLFRLLADVERAVVTGHPGRTYTSSGLESAAGPVLDQMVRTSDLFDRMRLLADLDKAVADTVGSEALETLWCLPAPGMVGPLTAWENAVRESRMWREAGDRM